MSRACLLTCSNSLQEKNLSGQHIIVILLCQIKGVFSLIYITNRQTIVHMTQHRTLTNKQHEPNQTLGVISRATAG